MEVYLSFDGGRQHAQIQEECSLSTVEMLQEVIDEKEAPQPTSVFTPNHSSFEPQLACKISVDGSTEQNMDLLKILRPS